MDAVQRAEDFLKNEHKYNEDRDICESENAVIDRLISESAEMRSVWLEIGKKLPVEQQFNKLLTLIISTATYFSENKIKDLKGAIDNGETKNSEIAKEALKLADLLDKQRTNSNRFALRSGLDDHPVACLEAWAELAILGKFSGKGQKAYQFDKYVQPELKKLRGQFDLKYWPSVADLLRGLASMADEKYVSPIDPIDVAAIESREISPLVFVRALMATIKEEQEHRNLPAKFTLTNKSIAAITNCALGVLEKPYTDATMAKAIQRIRSKEIKMDN